MFQWRRVQFFDKSLVKGEGEDAHPILQNRSVTSTAGGGGNLYFGDAEGLITSISRDFRSVTFLAYELQTRLLLYNKQRNVLISLGDDMDSEEGRNIVKLWNLDRRDISGVPILIRSFHIQPSKVKGPPLPPATTFAVTADLMRMCVSLGNGALVFVEGNLTRDRTYKQRLVRMGAADVCHGLFFHSQTHELFAVSPSSVELYRNGAKDPPAVLADEGAEPGCCALSDTNILLLGREEAVYYYDVDGRGPCFAFEGKKKMVAWFNHYLCVIGPGREVRPNSDMVVLTLYDTKNKLIAFSAAFPPITHMASEWGSLYCFARDRTVYQLAEKDMVTKLDSLFKKNLYTVAVNVAQSCANPDPLIITEIYRRFGDHMYNKGDYDGAMELYLKTVRRLEPSYVIRKFLDAQRIHNLTLYLEALHDEALANGDHTTLLLNCYTKLKRVDKLETFVTSPDRAFDVDTATRVCRQAGYYSHALYLAKHHCNYSTALKILIEDMQDYDGALDYIATLRFMDAEAIMIRYGRELASHVPGRTTDFLHLLCSGNYTEHACPAANHVESVDELSAQAESIHLTDPAPPASGEGSDAAGDDDAKPSTPQNLKANAEDFIPIFVSQHYLTRFLEGVASTAPMTPRIADTLLELYLRPKEEDESDADYQARLGKATKLLGDKECPGDPDHALVLCRTANFTRGLLTVYQRHNMFHEIIQLHMESHCYPALINICHAQGAHDPDLWLEVLRYFAENVDTCHAELKELLSMIEASDILPPLSVVQVLANSNAQLETLRDYLSRKVQAEDALIAEEQRHIQQYMAETEEMRREITDLKSNARVFQNSKCAACHSPLDLPTVHFLCMHSYHQRCLGDSEGECPHCSAAVRHATDVKRALESNVNNHEQFFKEMDGTEDGFSVAADYFGKGIFQKVNVVADTPTGHR